jgi:hypothetical protein
VSPPRASLSGRARGLHDPCSSAAVGSPLLPDALSVLSLGIRCASLLLPPGAAGVIEKLPKPPPALMGEGAAPQMEEMPGNPLELAVVRVSPADGGPLARAADSSSGSGIGAWRDASVERRTGQSRLESSREARLPAPLVDAKVEVEKGIESEVSRRRWPWRGLEEVD